jgi:hypothetical protein
MKKVLIIALALYIGQAAYAQKQVRKKSPVRATVFLTDSARKEDSAFYARVKYYNKKYGKRYGVRVMTGDISTGMTEAMILDIRGRKPDAVNTDATQYGTYVQWVYQYPGKNEYFYFTNGKLTSMQY